MINRNPFVVALLTLVTFGIYGWYWFYQTTQELRAKGAEIPNFILFFIPFVSIYWLYKYSEGVEKVTNQRFSTVAVFLLLFFVYIVGLAVIQSAYNETSAEPQGQAPTGYPNESIPQTTPPAGLNQAPTANTGVVSAAATPFAASPSPSPAPVAEAQPEEPTVVAQAPVEPTPVTPPTVEAPAAEYEQPAVAAAPANPVQVPDVNPEPQVIMPTQPEVIQPTQPAPNPVFEPQPQPTEDQNSQFPTSQV